VDLSQIEQGDGEEQEGEINVQDELPEIISR